MENKDPKGSVLNEQVGNSEPVSEDTKKLHNAEPSVITEETKADDQPAESAGNHEPVNTNVPPETEKESSADLQEITPDKEVPSSVELTADGSHDDLAPSKTAKPRKRKSKKAEEIPAQDNIPSLNEQGESGETILLPPEEDLIHTDLTLDEMTIEPADYSKDTKAELVEILKILIETRPVGEIKDDVENIKINFYKKHKAENEKLRKKFVEEGNAIEDFKPLEDPLEEKLKELLRNYRLLKSEYGKHMEKEKVENLRKKYEVIDRIKDLINRKESVNKTFQEFRDLQNLWREIGLVPQNELKNLWETYHYHVEKFYDFIKINEELRDLDFKRNLEAKIKLCEKAEELFLEPNVVSAFKTLQRLHEQWREIGPVPPDQRTEIWERFRDITAKINKHHQDYFVGLKTAQKQNLDAKTQLCERVEAILQSEITRPRDWEEKSREIIEIQKAWKAIGFSPKKYNLKIYKRFRDACDEFFKKKREFYSAHKEVLRNNLQLKTDLCIQAESLKDNTDWKKTSEDIIRLQEQWKEIGPVPRKHADTVWKRFRAACDAFFSRKTDYFSNIDKVYENNLLEKEKLLDEIENFKTGEDTNKDFEMLKEFQRRWSEIGFVPIAKKEEIQQHYRAAINRQFDHLNIDENKKSILKYKTKIENIREGHHTSHKIQQEREKFINKLKQLENDIVVWENNVGFFAKSKNADVMINEVLAKIEKAKKEIKVLEEKIKMIDSLDQEE
jgi:hypothetical protein